MAKIKNPVTIVQQSGGSGGTNKFTQLVDRSITTVTVEDLNGITIIGDSAFYLCQNLTDVFIPDGVTSIAINSFSECYNLSSVS